MFVFFRCGIAGEISPRFIIPSLIDAQSKEGKPTLLYDITDSNILLGSLKEFLQHLFSRFDLQRILQKTWLLYLQ